MLYVSVSNLQVGSVYAMRIAVWYVKIGIVIVLLPLLSGCTFLFGEPRPYVEPGVPRVFRADYNTVWNAVLDTIDDNGYVIIQMSKEDGYITTAMKESGYSKRKLSIRFLRTGDGVSVTINDYSEMLSTTSKTPYWRETGPHGWYQQVLLDEVSSRLKTP